MSIDFVRNRESHLTIAHDAVYRSLFKVIEAGTLSVGDRVLVEFTNGLWEQCIVVTVDPLKLVPYTPKHYIREDKMYRGTFIPEHLRDGVVSSNAATGDGADTSGSSGSSSSGAVSMDGTDVDENGTGTDGLFHGLYKECQCAPDCKHCKDCGKSMIGHLGYDHLYCKCCEDDHTEDPDTPDDIYDDVCQCQCCHQKLSVSHSEPPMMVLVSKRSAETGEMLTIMLRLHKPAEFDMPFIVSYEPSGLEEVITIPEGETYVTFEHEMCDADLKITARFTLQAEVTIFNRNLLSKPQELVQVSGTELGKPVEVKLVLNKTVEEATVVTLSSTSTTLVYPESIVFMTGEAEKTFVVVPFEEVCDLSAFFNETLITGEISVTTPRDA